MCGIYYYLLWIDCCECCNLLLSHLWRCSGSATFLFKSLPFTSEHNVTLYCLFIRAQAGKHKCWQQKMEVKDRRDLRETFASWRLQNKHKRMGCSGIWKKAIRDSSWIGCDKVAMGEGGSTSIESAAISSSVPLGSIQITQIHFLTNALTKTLDSSESPFLSSFLSFPFLKSGGSLIYLHQSINVLCLPHKSQLAGMFLLNIPNLKIISILCNTAWLWNSFDSLSLRQMEVNSLS